MIVNPKATKKLIIADIKTLVEPGSMYAIAGEIQKKKRKNIIPKFKRFMLKIPLIYYPIKLILQVTLIHLMRQGNAFNFHHHQKNAHFSGDHHFCKKTENLNKVTHAKIQSKPKTNIICFWFGDDPLI